jgi:hypothetical protein
MEKCANGTTQFSMGRSPMISSATTGLALKGQHNFRCLCCPFRTNFLFLRNPLGVAQG